MELDFLVTLFFLIDVVWRWDWWSVVGIVTHWLGVTLPLVMIQMPPWSIGLMRQVLWINTVVCAYCCWRIARDEQAAVYSYYMWIQLFVLGCNLLLMTLRTVFMNLLTMVLLQGTLWGVAINGWWKDTMKEYEQQRAQFEQETRRTAEQQQQQEQQQRRRRWQRTTNV